MIEVYAPMQDHAVFSADRAYRWQLSRIVGDGTRPLVICGLNPSDADETDNDPTITREIDFAQRWNCHWLLKVNAYGFVETKPSIMFALKKKQHVDIVGAENDAYIANAIATCIKYDGIFLTAWGRNIEPFRQQQLAAMIGPIAKCIKTNKDGTPIHPLYQPKTSMPREWRLTPNAPSGVDNTTTKES